MGEEEEKEKKFAKKINMDKAMNISKLAIVIIVISISTYVLPLVVEKQFDFGIVFEILSLIFLFIAKMNMEVYDIEGSKKFTKIAMIPVGWLLIYDFIRLFTYIDIIDLIFLGSYFAYEEKFLIVFMILLYLIMRNIAKAENPEKYKTSTDWFYEKYEGEEKKP